MDELREKIAKEIALFQALCCWKTWEEIPEAYQQIFLHLADQILALIKEAGYKSPEEVEKIESRYEESFRYWRYLSGHR